MEDQKKPEEKTQMYSEKAEISEGESVEKEYEKGRGKRTKKPEEMTKQELLKKLSETQEQAQDNYDLYMRTYAEMENIKKRGIKEREELAKYANESLIKEILPTIDSLEKAISHAIDDENSSALVEGLELTRDGLMKTLEKAGLEEVEAIGKPFDPNFHEAVSQQRDDTVAPGHVMIELQKGYTLNGRLIRPSTVVISSGKDTNEEEFV
ncbi:MAG: nucleotide exchange factor GrpE [Deltaproteobacteria bacterium]|nr:MAG: nucleotide exchange factor GrpE [Deltaproteobacteria bacterium]UCH07658.1 MAG: nucleotide exchange factor GrpE [Deltaproteobacteria bacterium]